MLRIAVWKHKTGENESIEVVFNLNNLYKPPNFPAAVMRANSATLSDLMVSSCHFPGH